MTWNYKQQEDAWLETEMGKFLKEALVTEVIVPRTYNAIRRHFIFQSHTYNSSMYHWKIEGKIKELELIASEERPVAGIGVAGAKNLQGALNDRSTE